jgi:SWI/SNF-related matrix-associated actin-dependent regulator of chromatin subfamily D
MKQNLAFQEALKRPMKQKRKLRIFISNTAFPANETPGAAGPTPAGDPGAPSPAPEGSATTCWELRVEGRLIDEDKKVSC